MRYGKEQKRTTRRRILDVAGRRFKERGLDGAGIAGVMAAAGLTNGAFYAHFASKEDLIAHVLIDQLRNQRAAFAEAPDTAEGLRQIIHAYLSPAHRDSCAAGCPSAALLEEIARRPDATREAFTNELLGLASDVAQRLPVADAGRIEALQLFAYMIGTIQIARALSDAATSDQLLGASRITAEHLARGTSGSTPLATPV